MDYMRERIRRVGTPGPKVIGIDEISIRKGHHLPDRGQRSGAPNRRLNTAYLLKESFGQLWDYTREAWARKFGIAAYCQPENKVALGFVDGLNNKM